MEMIFDVTSNVVVKNIHQIENSLDKSLFTDQENKALRILLAWNGRYGKDEVAPTIYTKMTNFMEAIC